MKVAEGVWKVETPRHGGLKLSTERWNSLPPETSQTMLTPGFAEEDCEEQIVAALLGLGNEQDLEQAVRIAKEFPRYAPALPRLRTLTTTRR